MRKSKYRLYFCNEYSIFMIGRILESMKCDNNNNTTGSIINHSSEAVRSGKSNYSVMTKCGIPFQAMVIHRPHFSNRVVRFVLAGASSTAMRCLSTGTTVKLHRCTRNWPPPPRDRLSGYLTFCGLSHLRMQILELLLDRLPAQPHFHSELGETKICVCSPRNTDISQVWLRRYTTSRKVAGSTPDEANNFYQLT
jgi:hypothetical protein